MHQHVASTHAKHVETFANNAISVADNFDNTMNCSLVVCFSLPLSSSQYMLYWYYCYWVYPIGYRDADNNADDNDDGDNVRLLTMLVNTIVIVTCNRFSLLRS